MKKIIFFLMVLASTTAHADTTLGSAASLKWTISAVYVNTDGKCGSSTWKTVFDDSASPLVADFIQSPSLGTGAIPNGTYNCIAIKMSSVIVAGASGLASPCNVSTVNLNIYSPTSCSGCTSQNIDGTAGPSPSASAQTIVLYLSTFSTNAAGSGLFMKPTVNGDNVNGYPLASPLVVSGTQSNSFVVNHMQTLGTYTATPAQCDIISSPTFSFQ